MKLLYLSKLIVYTNLYYSFDKIKIYDKILILCNGQDLLISHALRGGRKVAEIKVKENETLDSALRRFKRSCARSGILAEVRKREHYEKPSVKRKKKSEAARKRKR